MIRRILPCALAALALAAGARRAAAWNFEGHMLIAEIAWQNLDAADRAALTKLLKAHPHYALYLTKGDPTPGPSQDEYVFLKAATWPDAVRPSTPPYKPLIIDPVDEKNVTQYHHPEWHYINIAFVPAGDPNSSLNFKAVNAEKGDVLSTIRNSAKEFTSAGATDQAKAIDIAWLEHTIGDLHQPLHAVTLISTAFPPPDGDRGGNSISVSPPAPGPNGKPIVQKLHALWDGALGNVVMENFSIDNLPELQARAKAIQGKHPLAAAKPLLQQHGKIEDWALESYELARKDVYLNGDILKLPEHNKIVELPPTYLLTAQADAETRAALAGYRLAATLHDALKAPPTK
jgi:hypothetical protein